MPETYQIHRGYEFPAEMSPIFLDLMIAKKHREFRAKGIEFKDPWEALISAAQALIPPPLFTVTPYTEEHAHDFVMYNNLITWGSAACSKAQPLDATVFTPSGPKEMKDIQVGDLVFGADGRPTKVLKIHEVGEQEEYQVVFNDRTSTRCAGDHLWLVHRRENKQVKAKTRTTESLVGCEQGRYGVPITQPVQFAEREIAIDPYLMGVLLGDGSLGGASGTNNLSITSMDQDILDNLRGRLPDGYELVHTARMGYRIVKKARYHGGQNACIQEFKKYGLWGKLSHEKHVPLDYLYNSVEVRREVLAGLLDTDGCCTKTGAVNFSSTSKTLAENVAFLVRSLGGRASIHTRDAGYRIATGAYKACRLVYCVCISMSDMSGLFYCGRKRVRVKARYFSGRRYINFVRKTGRSVSMKCITVSDPRGLYLTDDFIVTHNSNDYGLFALLDWIVDPYKTLWLIGSTTKIDLRRRTWEAVARYFVALQNNDKNLLIPGKLSEIGLSIVNVADSTIPESGGQKAAIVGVALNEDGRLQGAHLSYVRVLVDELATIRDHEALKTGVANLRVGTTDFRLIGLANPTDWQDPSCQYCIPALGEKVTVDTGSWLSTRGFFVRHHDGLKSPCMVDPSLEAKYPFLMKRSDYQAILQDNDGNEDAPDVWKMVRGFPAPAGSTVPTVLDPKIAAAMKVSEPPAEIQRWEGAVAGVDPAWSEGGDASVFARCDIVWSENKPVLDFTGKVYRIPILATSNDPITKQQRDAVAAHLRMPGAPRLKCVAVDSSGNQGLADDLDMYIGAGCMHVNSSEKASDNPVRAVGTGAPAKDSIKDRGTEAWVILAEFCRAGQVRGLPANALQALTTRRFKMQSRDTIATPLRLESKDDFAKRFGGSPNDADACALAALVAKERFGVMPYGGILPPPDEDAFRGNYQASGLPSHFDDEATPSNGGFEPVLDDVYEPC